MEVRLTERGGHKSWLVIYGETKLDEKGEGTTLSTPVEGLSNLQIQKLFKSVEKIFVDQLSKTEEDKVAVDLKKSYMVLTRDGDNIDSVSLFSNDRDSEFYKELLNLLNQVNSKNN